MSKFLLRETDVETSSTKSAERASPSWLLAPPQFPPSRRGVSESPRFRRSAEAPPADAWLDGVPPRVSPRSRISQPVRARAKRQLPTITRNVLDERDCDALMDLLGSNGRWRQAFAAKERCQWDMAQESQEMQRLHIQSSRRCQAHERAAERRARMDRQDLRPVTVGGA